MRITFFTIATLVCSSFGSPALAAPHPATSTSKLISPQLGLYRSPLGFQVNAGQSGWVQSEAPRESKFIATMYKAPTPGAKPLEGGTLTVRIDKIAREVPLDKYIQRWMKEYPKYGFDVIGSTVFAQSKDRGYVLDLLNRDSGRQLRQVVFMKKQTAVILTCRDQAMSFKETLKSCNQIIRTFNWNE